VIFRHNSALFCLETKIDRRPTFARCKKKADYDWLVI